MAEPQTRAHAHFEMADELEKLSDQIRAYGRYDNDLARNAAWAQIQARCERLGTMGVHVRIDHLVFKAPYKKP